MKKIIFLLLLLTHLATAAIKFYGLPTRYAVEYDHLLAFEPDTKRSIVWCFGNDHKVPRNVLQTKFLILGGWKNFLQLNSIQPWSEAAANERNILIGGNGRLVKEYSITLKSRQQLIESLLSSHCFVADVTIMSNVPDGQTYRMILGVPRFNGGWWKHYATVNDIVVSSSGRLPKAKLKEKMGTKYWANRFKDELRYSKERASEGQSPEWQEYSADNPFATNLYYDHNLDSDDDDDVYSNNIPSVYITVDDQHYDSN